MADASPKRIPKYLLILFRMGNYIEFCSLIRLIGYVHHCMNDGFLWNNMPAIQTRGTSGVLILNTPSHENSFVAIHSEYYLN